MAKILVVGGAGYVGSSVTAWLLDQGHEVSVLDDLSTGHRELLLTERFYEGQAGNRALLKQIFSEGSYDGVMHFAAKSLVAESVEKPELYYENNVVQTRELLEGMNEAGVRNFVFSSTCAIFGDPGDRKISEELPKNPINPYGKTKLQAEEVMQEFARERGMRVIALRYFNAAGAEAGVRTGEWHDPETHLIPNIFKAVVEGRAVSVFGVDYPTSDGTCVRDYIHVTDLAQAHERALLRMLESGNSVRGFEAFNLGSGNGFSVREVIDTVGKVLRKKTKVEERDRRPGDPSRLVADSRLAQRELGFRPERNLNDIISSAWKWEKKRLQI